MIALDGFFLTAFIPTAAMMLLGLGCLWRYRHSELNNTLVFLATFFLFMVLWRIPTIIDRRYMLPTIVPGILLTVLFFKTLSERLVPIGRWLCGVLLLATAIAGTAKALRFQESKPYLTDIPAIIHQEIRQHHWNSVLVLALGNLGGHLGFNDLVTLKHVRGDLKFSFPGNQEEFFKNLNRYNKPEYLLLRYSVLYILISSRKPSEDFSKKWQTRYGRIPEFCYEFIRPKDRMRYQMFRLVSPYRSAHLTVAQRLDRYRQFNLLPNPDFSQYQELPADSSEFQILMNRGVKLGKAVGHSLVPADWQFDMTTWQKKAVPAGVEYTERGKLHMFCKSYIAFFQAFRPFAGGKIYQLGGWVTVRTRSIFNVQVMKTQNGKMISRLNVFAILAQPGTHEFSALIDLSDWTGQGIIRFELANGDIELENIYLVDQSVFLY